MRSRLPLTLTNGRLQAFWHYTTGGVESLRLADDPTQMEWIKGRFGFPSGSCFLDKREEIEGGVRLTFEYMVDLRLVVDRVMDYGGLHERYTWSNVGKKPVEIKDGEVGVYVTFADRGERSDVFLARRAYTHVLTGSHLYMASSRADGSPQGMALTTVEGQVACVKEEYPTRRDRGDLIAYLPAMTLAPQESVGWEWVVYDYDDFADYRAKTADYAPVWQDLTLWGDKDRVENDKGDYVLLDSRSLWERVQFAKGGRDGDTSLYTAYLMAIIKKGEPLMYRQEKLVGYLEKYYKKSPHGLDMMPLEAIEIAGMQDKLAAQIEAAKAFKRGPFNVWAEWGRYCLICSEPIPSYDHVQRAQAILRPFLTTPWGDKIPDWEDTERIAALLR